MTNYVYKEKPKTVKAVRWDGELETLPAIAELTKEASPGYYPGGEWEELTVSKGHLGMKLLITSEQTTYHVPRGCYVVVDAGKLAVMPQQEFESKYQHSSSESSMPEDKAPDLRGLPAWLREGYYRQIAQEPYGSLGIRFNL